MYNVKQQSYQKTKQDKAKQNNNNNNNNKTSGKLKTSLRKGHSQFPKQDEIFQAEHSESRRLIAIND